MTVSSATNEATYQGNGVTTVFPLPFRFFANSDITVERINDVTKQITVLALGTDYSLTGAGEPEVSGGATGALTTTVPVASGYSIRIVRFIPLTQPTDIVNQGRFFPEVHETVFDRLLMQIQQVFTVLVSSLKFNAAGNYDAGGRRITNVGAPTSASDAANKAYVDAGDLGSKTYADNLLLSSVRGQAGEVISPLPPASSRNGLLLSFNSSGDPVLVAPQSGSGADLAINLAANNDPAKGSGIPAFNATLEYAPWSVGFALKETPVENSLWAGFFDAWPMGYSSAVGAVERIQIPAGVTHGRTGFAAGTTIFQSGPGQMRVQRDIGNSDTANHTVCMNLSAAETALLRGKTCTAHIFARAGSGYTGAGVTLRVQYSIEPEQPVLSSVAQYTNGYEVLDSVSFLPSAQFAANPQVLTFSVPENATQVAIALIIPFIGVAGASDYVEFKNAAVYPFPAYRKVREQGRSELNAKAATRYQTSYPYGSSFGANSTQGSVSAVSSSTAVNWAVVAGIRFSPRMVVPPRFQFLAPGSGTRSRWLNVGAGTFLNGIAFDLSDSGVTVTNNGAAADNTRYLFQWSADCLF